MASNIGPIITDFLKSEGKRLTQTQRGRQQIQSAVSDVVSMAVGSGGRGQPQRRQGETPQIEQRRNLFGKLQGPVLHAAMKHMRTAQKTITAATAFGTKGATPEAGAAMQGSVELIKSQVNAFTNIFTAPSIKSVGDFLNIMADSPNQIMSFGEALLSVTGRLKDVSVSFAKIGASREIRQLERDIKTGQQTGESATRLNESIEELKDATLPIQNDIYNVTADLVSDLVPLMQELYEALAPWLKVTLVIVAEILRYVAGILIPLLIAILNIAESLLRFSARNALLFGPLGLMLRGQLKKMVSELQKARMGIEEMLEDDSKADPHKLAVQALFGKVDSITNPPKPPPKKP